MRIKKLIRALLVVMSLAVIIPTHAETVTDPKRSTRTETMDPARAEQLTKRLEEIKAMDKKNLSRAEKKALRKEVKEIKKEMAVSGGVYISVGALLVIILLLILLA